MAEWNQQERHSVETELFRIADQLLHMQQYQGSIDLFNGKAGILLFYLRLYTYTHEPQHLQYCADGTLALLQDSAVYQQEYYTLYTGATGLLYLCGQLYQTTKEPTWLQKALALAAHFEAGMLQGVVQDDLLSGYAGNILALTHLYAHTQHEPVLRLIRQLTDHMIRQARIAPQGLRWGHVKRAYDCLTGFSHGAAGIAYALLQAAQYFQDEGLQYLAAQALEYEMLYYDAENTNWLDLRLTSTSIREDDIMEWQAADFKKYASNVNAWAHGAAGIGMARLAAWKITGDPIYLQQVQLALDRSLSDAHSLQRGDFTLCSGYGGTATFLLQAAAALQQPQLQEVARQIAAAAVRYYQQHGTYNIFIADANNDPGLLSGLAGVGYLLLEVLLPYQEDTILHPAITAAPVKQSLYQPGEVKAQLFHRYYSTTLNLLQQHNIPIQEICNSAKDITTLESLLRQQLNALPATLRLQAQDSFTYEQSLAAAWQQHKGWLCYAKRKELLQENINEALQTVPELLQQKVFLPMPRLQLCHTLWPWHIPAQQSPRPEGHHYLHHSHEHGVSTFPISAFTSLLLNSLRPQLTLQQVGERLCSTHFKDANEITRQTLVRAMDEQVRVLLQQGFIYPA